MPCKTFYLQMCNPRPELQRAFVQEGVELVEITPVDARINQRMYRNVGGPWGWSDKAEWSLAQWESYVGGVFGEASHIATGVGEASQIATGESIITMVLYVDQQEAGYFELAIVSEPVREVEIRYFGLLPEALGLGLGAPLLSAAIERGWQESPRRLWVHTCELDHPAALTNYQNRGFELYKTTLE